MLLLLLLPGATESMMLHATILFRFMHPTTMMLMIRTGRELLVQLGIVQPCRNETARRIEDRVVLVVIDVIVNHARVLEVWERIARCRFILVGELHRIPIIDRLLIATQHRLRMGRMGGDRDAV